MYWQRFLLAELLLLALGEIPIVNTQHCPDRTCFIDIFYVSPENESWFRERKCPPDLYSGRNETTRDPAVATDDIYYFYCRVCDKVLGKVASCHCFLCHWTQGCYLRGVCNSVSIDTPNTPTSTRLTTQSLSTITDRIIANVTSPTIANPSVNTTTEQVGKSNIGVIVGVTLSLTIIISCLICVCLFILCLVRRRRARKPYLTKEEGIYMEVIQSRDSLARSLESPGVVTPRDHNYFPLASKLSFDSSRLTENGSGEETEKLRGYRGFGLSAVRASNEEMYGIMKKRDSKFDLNEETDPWYYSEIQMKKLDSTLNRSGKRAFLKVPSHDERNKAQIGKSSFDDYSIGIEKSIDKYANCYEALESLNEYRNPPDTNREILESMSHMRFKEINPDTMKILETLGKGEFGSVLKAEWESPLGEVMVAVKVLRDTEEDGEMMKIAFLQEAAILGQFSHPNILRLVGVVTLTVPNMIVTELMQEELKRFLLALQTQHTQELDYDTLAPHFLCFSRQVASGMQHLAQRECIHRDIAARNILLTDKCVCKIADFGMSRRLEAESDYYRVQGANKLPVKWSAPEAIFFKRYTLKSDVWSYGMLLYEIWSVGRKPWPYENNQSAVEKMARAVNLPPPSGCPRALYQLMVSTWHPKPDQRPDMNEVVTRLALPDEELLARPELEGQMEDEAFMLGEEPAIAEGLYKDLQIKYLYLNL